MISFPQIQIRQQFAKISFKAEHGTLLQEQPKVKMDYKTTLPRVEIKQPLGELSIDQSRAWAAYGLGGHLKTMLDVYDNARQIAMEGIASIARRGDRLAAIHEGGNAIAMNATDYSRRYAHDNMLGPASYDNVDIEYIAQPVEFNPIAGKADTRMTKSEPVNQYTKGEFQFSMAQYAKVTIIPPPPRVDLQM